MVRSETPPVFAAVAVLLAGLVAWPGCQRQPATDAAAPAEAAHPEAAPVTAPFVPAGMPANPVQAEMRLLNEAARDWVTAIAQRELGSIPPGLSRVHAARLVTEAALKRGAYAPPKGGAAVLDAFVRQDEAFHDELVRLLEAAKANDLPSATKQLGVVLEGCTSCHMTYRF